jgi:hypothetical protein
LDTRNKIVSFEEAVSRLKAEGLTAVQMDADPLLAEVVSALPGGLVAFVSERAEAYLPLESRAQLAAALKSVRYVALGEYAGAKDLRGDEAAARQALEQLVIRKSEVV